GVIGDWMLRLPALVAGGTLAGPVCVAIALSAGVGMLLCFAVATGFGWRAYDGDAEGPLEEDDARGSISLGFINHRFLSLKARLPGGGGGRGGGPGRRAGRGGVWGGARAPRGSQRPLGGRTTSTTRARKRREGRAHRRARHDGRAAAMCCPRSNSSPRRKRSGAPCSAPTRWRRTPPRSKACSPTSACAARSSMPDRVRWSRFTSSTPRPASNLRA